jgi:predicted helicase
VDEAGINDVVELLNRANAQAIRNDFGKKTDGEDPVIHFYEHFLGAYDKKLKVERGVFYTPKPIVSYIVRSVHELLQMEFGLMDGLADTSTWSEVKERHKGLNAPEGINPDIEPFVQILDPATGTATFLIEVIDVIHNTMVAKWDKERVSKSEQIKRWNTYVPTHLLPRLYAYELMMAPYAIAHMKVGLKLTETGFTAWEKLGSENRANIFLTNALEPWESQLALAGFNALAHEAAAVNEVKRKKRFTVVIGNPPYAGISSNMTEQAQRIVDAYRFVDGAVLNEKKVWLQDDYVKFIRRAQATIDNTQVGVFGYITNHGYLDNPTFRGMRQSLMQTFEHLCLLDLHGNTNKKEQSPDGSEDKNVFDIRQGVAVCLATRGGRVSAVEHAEQWGSRKEKYSWLARHSVRDTKFSALTPESPYYFLKPKNSESDSTYDTSTPIDQIFLLSNSGIVTARDGLVLDLDLPALRQRIADFRNPKFSDSEIQTRFDLTENYMWRVSDARKQLIAATDCEALYTEVLYRPFNTRHIFFHPSVVWRPRMDVMRHMQNTNLALITTRQTRDPFGALATRLIVGHKSVAAYDINSVFPLYTYPASREQRDLLSSSEKLPNLAPEFLKKVATVLGISQEVTHGLPTGLTAEDIFHYAYAVLHSPGYRTRYAEFLKIDFPRLPLTGNMELFRVLARLGGELAALHLLESPRLDQPITEFVGHRNPEVEKVSWTRDTVWVDKEQTLGFRGVREPVWNFHIGGYQVCEKWLKDRKGRKLTKVDIEHYQKIVVALSETIRLMTEIDKVIDEHGGWPGAFQAAK